MNQDPLINRKRQEYAYRFLKNNRYALRREALLQLVHKCLSLGELTKIANYIGSTLIRSAESGENVRFFIHRRPDREKDLVHEDLKREIQMCVKMAPASTNSFEHLIELAFGNDTELFIKVAESIQATLKRKSEKQVKRSNLSKNLNEIKQVFELSDKEGEILLFFYLIAGDYYLQKAVEERRFGREDWFLSLKFICRFFNLTPKKMRDLFTKDSRLIRSGIMKKNETGVELTEHVKNYLYGLSNMELVDSFYSKRTTEVNLSLNDHVMSSKALEAVKALMLANGGNNVLIYGRPGTGKTAFVFSLGHELGREVYWIKQHDPEGREDLEHRKSSIVAAMSCLPKNALIAVDECDPIVNSTMGSWPCEHVDNDSKAWINDLLEKTEHKIVWISNKVDSIDDSTKRRFSYSYEFSDLTHKQRRKVWNTVLEKNKVDYISESEIETYAKQYSINAGGISLAINDVKSMKELKGKNEKKSMLNNLLSRHEKFVFDQPEKMVRKNSKYNLDVVNSTVDLAALIQEVSSFYSYLEDHPVNPEISNMSILLAGPSGTGKTEYAKHLSDSVGKELMLRRLSDVRSMWYGESLKNIAKMFSEATENDNILYLDEADTFFLDRESSTSSNGKDETNELLTQMENFKGLLLCSTNLIDSMDPAVMRRFSSKIQFDYLRPEGVVTLFKQFFGEKLEKSLSKSDLSRLQSLGFLTPGDYKVVWQKNFFKEKVKAEVLIEQLALERDYKKDFKGRIGLAT